MLALAIGGRDGAQEVRLPGQDRTEPNGRREQAAVIGIDEHMTDLSILPSGDPD